METEKRICKKCGSDGPQLKRGKTKKKNIRYFCKQCKKWYVLEEARYTEEFKASAVQLYLESNSSRAVGRILNIGKNTAWEWARKYQENLSVTEE
jgi:transposase-like protein